MKPQLHVCFFSKKTFSSYTLPCRRCGIKFNSMIISFCFYIQQMVKEIVGSPRYLELLEGPMPSLVRGPGMLDFTE